MGRKRRVGNMSMVFVYLLENKKNGETGKQEKEHR